MTYYSVKWECTLIQSGNRKENSFGQLAGKIAAYDVADLLSTVAALQLLPNNASRITRLEALSHSVASLAPDANRPNISTGKLRQVCNDTSLQSIAHYEDPATSQFAEEFTFFGGSYLVLPGIVQDGEFMLANLCKAIFLGPQTSLPDGFRSQTLRTVSAALLLLNAVAEQAGLKRGTPPASNRYKEIFLPDAPTLTKLKNAVRFTQMDINALLRSANLDSDSLARLTCRAGEVSLDSYDLVNGPLLWRPFVCCDDVTVLVLPGMVVSAIRQAIIELAFEWNVQNAVAGLYHRAVWQGVKRSLRYTANVVVSRQPSASPNVSNSSDGFFTLDGDKIMYCLLATDPLNRAADTDPFGEWIDETTQQSINDHIRKIEGEALTAFPAPNELLIVVLVQGLGGGGALGLTGTPADSPLIALSAADLKTISLIEGGDPLALFNFARARDRARKRFKLVSTDILDEFCIYRTREYSFYFSDEAPPNLVVIPPGDSLNLQMEIARERDFHALRTADKSVVEVTSLHSTAAIPICCPVTDLGERVRLVVEGLPVLIWIIGPEGVSSNDHTIYALFADAISYWLWQFTPILAPVFAALPTKEPIQIEMQLPSHSTWQFPRETPLESERRAVTASFNPNSHRLSLTVDANSVSMFQTADNRGERELMRSILSSFSQVVPVDSPHALTPSAIEAALQSVAPLGTKKMLLFLNSAVTPELDNTDIPEYRPLQKVWISEQLDNVGQHLVQDLRLKTGDLQGPDKNAILKDVAFYCFNQLQRTVATISPKGLLKFLILNSESVHRRQALDRLTIPTRLECFRTIPNMIEQLSMSIPEQANAGLASRFLVEYAVAQPPVGLRPISLDLYDEMRSWAYHCINYAMLSDAVHFGIEEYHVSVLPSERLGIDGAARRSAIRGHMRAFALDQISSAAEAFNRQWDLTPRSPGDQSFREELDAATKVEFGIPLSEILELMELGITISQEAAETAPSMPKGEFVKQAAAKLNWDELKVNQALDLLSLNNRATFFSPPAGYVVADVYPWRYNRPLSYMRRPFLCHVSDGTLEITWGVRHLRVAQRFLVDQCASGRLKARSKPMRSFMNRRLGSKGDEFNDRVSDFFSGFEEMRVESRVTRIGKLRELQEHLGDIDVLVGDTARRRILVIECKDLSAARTPYEMANEYTALFGGQRGKKSIVEKHQARALWVESNSGAVAEFLGMAPGRRLRIVPLIIVDQPLMASYVSNSPIQVLSFEEVKRFWPKLRRI